MRFAAAICSLWAAMVLASPLRGQTPPGTVSGVVLETGTETPLRGATVTLMSTGPGEEEALGTTDAQGRFVFSAVPPGAYRLIASKADHSRVAFPRSTANRAPATLAVTAGESRTGLVLHLPHLAAISGTVVDSDGDPIPFAEVQLLMPVHARQRSRWNAVQFSNTDAAGHYRLHEIAPGRYVVAVRHGSPYLRSAPQATPGQTAQQYGLGTQFFPGAESASGAATLTVLSGKELEGIDFRLTPKPIGIIRVHVAIPPEAGSDNVMLRFSSGEDDNRPNMMTTPVDAKTGYVDVPNMLAGSYRVAGLLNGGGKLYGGVTTAEVTGAGIGEASLTLEPAVDVTGSVAVEGPVPPRHSGRMTVVLTPGEGALFIGEQRGDQVKADGTFKVANVPPGVWDISVRPMPPGGYIKSMRMGDADVLTADMTIGSAAAGPLKIVISTHGAVLEGDVLAKEQAAPATVILAPTGKWQNVESFFSLTHTDEKGHFKMKGLTPGSYAVYALEDFDASRLYDPEALKPFAGEGVAVELREGATVSRKLQLLSAQAGGTQ